jgi:hypothetical protein
MSPPFPLPLDPTLTKIFPAFDDFDDPVFRFKLPVYLLEEPVDNDAFPVLPELIEDETEAD